MAYNAPHFPLHAPQEDIAKYEALYAQGWDKVREQRLAKQKALGLVPKDLELTPRSHIPANRYNGQTGWADKDNPAWDTLPDDRRADLARRMAVFAAMVDHMDRSIGRLVADLRASGQFDNTLILFLSDNGACAEWDPFGFDVASGPKNVLHRGADLAKVGGPGSYISYGSAWANASNAPWRLYKHYNHEGGISTPFIAHWPAGLKRRGEFDERPSYITDVLPTCLEVAGGTYPRERDGHEILPPEGVSLLPSFRGEPAPRSPACWSSNTKATGPCARGPGSSSPFGTSRGSSITSKPIAANARTWRPSSLNGSSPGSGLGRMGGALLPQRDPQARRKPTDRRQSADNRVRDRAPVSATVSCSPREVIGKVMPCT